jgi:intracellular multiplication protein IcmB
MSRLKSFFAKTLSLTAYDLCDLQAVENDKTFVTADGYYCSLFLLEGSRSYLGEDGHPEAVSLLASRLNSLFQQPGFQVQFSFIQDPEGGSDFVASQTLKQLHDVADKFSLNIEPLIEERRSIWKSKSVPFEAAYIVVKTSLASLSRSEQERAGKERSPLPYVAFAQDPSKGYRKLLSKHQSFASSLQKALSAVCVCEELAVGDAGKAINTYITGRYDQTFRLRFAQSKRAVPPRLQEVGDRPGDPSPAMQPPIAHQFWTERPQELEEEPSLVKCHNRHVAPIQVETWSDKPQKFEQLVAQVGRKFPFSISFTFQTGKEQVAAFLGKNWRLAKIAEIFNKANSEQASASKVLQTYLSANGANALKGHLSMATWAKSKDECLARKEELSALASSWCGLRPVEYLDDPVKLWLETIPALSRKPVSVPSAIEIKDAITYLPIDRPATFFKEGPMPLFSVDYKPMPFKMGAEFQATWNNNWFAPPGSGKSVGMFGSCLALLLNQENRQIPKQTYLDVGHAGVGLVKLFKAILGPERAHRSHYFTMRNDGNTYINPFDTMTCVRYPTEQEKQDLLSILSTIYAAESDGGEGKYLEVLIPNLITKVYELKSDKSGGKGDPNPYLPRRDQEIDDRLRQGDIDLPEEPLWWEVADALLYAGEHRLANRATRLAVPLLRDISTIIAADDDIKRRFSDITIGSQKILDYIRLFTESTLSTIKMLNAPTNIDLSELDLLVINLGDVLSSASAVERKNSAVYYLLAMVAGARDYFQRPEVVESPNFSDDPFVKSFHKERIKGNFSTKRHLILDEYHQFNKIPALDDRIVKGRLIGRKNNLIISLATQYDDQVSEIQRDTATNTFFMAAGDRKIMDGRQGRYKFSNDIKEQSLREQVGPGTMLHQAIKKDSVTWQVCRDVKGPLELWAFSSTNEDLDLRDAMESRIGFWEACKVLGRNFPGGSIGEFHSTFTKFVQRTFDDTDAAKRWAEILAKKILSEPDTWRLSIVEDDE